VRATDSLCWLGSKCFFSFNHGFDTIVHVLYEVDLRSAKSALVRDIVDVIVGLSVLTVSATDLNVESICDCFELSFF
jgi:hypothetical protein